MSNTSKHWEVEFGNNWSRHIIEARTFDEAVKKAKKLLSDVPPCERHITKLELVSQTTD